MHSVGMLGTRDGSHSGCSIRGTAQGSMLLEVSYVLKCLNYFMCIALHKCVME